MSATGGLCQISFAVPRLMRCQSRGAVLIGIKIFSGSPQRRFFARGESHVRALIAGVVIIIPRQRQPIAAGVVRSDCRAGTALRDSQEPRQPWRSVPVLRWSRNEGFDRAAAPRGKPSLHLLSAGRSSQNPKDEPLRFGTKTTQCSETSRPMRCRPILRRSVSKALQNGMTKTEPLPSGDARACVCGHSAGMFLPKIRRLSSKTRKRRQPVYSY